MKSTFTSTPSTSIFVSGKGPPLCTGFMSNSNFRALTNAGVHFEVSKDTPPLFHWAAAVPVGTHGPLPVWALLVLKFGLVGFGS